MNYKNPAKSTFYLNFYAQNSKIFFVKFLKVFSFKDHKKVEKNFMKSGKIPLKSTTYRNYMGESKEGVTAIASICLSLLF